MNYSFIFVFNCNRFSDNFGGTFRTQFLVSYYYKLINIILISYNIK